MLPSSSLHNYAKSGFLGDRVWIKLKIILPTPETDMVNNVWLSASAVHSIFLTEGWSLFYLRNKGFAQTNGYT